MNDKNWRKEYKTFTTNKKHLELLENGPKSLAQAKSELQIRGAK